MHVYNIPSSYLLRNIGRNSSFITLLLFITFKVIAIYTWLTFQPVQSTPLASLWLPIQLEVILLSWSVINVFVWIGIFVHVDISTGHIANPCSLVIPFLSSIFLQLFNWLLCIQMNAHKSCNYMKRFYWNSNFLKII